MLLINYYILLNKKDNRLNSNISTYTCFKRKLPTPMVAIYAFFFYPTAFTSPITPCYSLILFLLPRPSLSQPPSFYPFHSLTLPFSLTYTFFSFSFSLAPRILSFFLFFYPCAHSNQARELRSSTCPSLAAAACFKGSTPCPCEENGTERLRNEKKWEREEIKYIAGRRRWRGKEQKIEPE